MKIQNVYKIISITLNGRGNVMDTYSIRSIYWFLSRFSPNTRSNSVKKVSTNVAHARGICKWGLTNHVLSVFWNPIKNSMHQNDNEQNGQFSPNQPGIRGSGCWFRTSEVVPSEVARIVSVCQFSFQKLPETTRNSWMGAASYAALCAILCGLANLLVYTGYEASVFIGESVLHSVNGREPHRSVEIRMMFFFVAKTQNYPK